MSQNNIISSSQKQSQGLDQEKTGSFSNEDRDGDEEIPYKVNSKKKKKISVLRSCPLQLVKYRAV